MNNYIYKSNGNYLGFIQNDLLYSRDGICLGWIEGGLVWDTFGRFRGIVHEISGHKYILMNRFKMLPASRTPKNVVSQITPPAPSANIAPIGLPVEYGDAF